MTPTRTCCDGLCRQGRDCPVTTHRSRPENRHRLAPGVIEGPHRHSTLRSRVARALANLLLRSRRRT